MTTEATDSRGAAASESEEESKSESEEDRLLGLRREFASLDERTHLFSHALGAMPTQSRVDAAAEMFDSWADDPVGSLTGSWVPAAERLCSTIARVVGADDDTIVLTDNCSAALATVASGLSFSGSRDRIVYDDLNFSTVHYIWQAQERHGARINVVPSTDGLSLPIEELLAAIDRHTLIVPVSHAQFRNSAAYDVERLVEHAHSVGALVLLDCYQSAGVMPVELKRWDVDIACGGSLKWACGGPGAGWLYVRPDLLDRIEPTLTGWLAHAEPFSFDMGPMRYADDRRRLETGVPGFPAAFSARAGWETIERAGVDAIRRKSLRQTAHVRELALQRSITVNTPADDHRRGGTIALDFVAADEAAVLLREFDVLVDHRPGGGMRVSPHFFTTDAELDHFFDCLDIVRGRLRTL